MQWVKWHNRRSVAPVELDSWIYTGSHIPPNEIELCLRHGDQKARLIMSPAEARLLAKGLIEMANLVAPLTGTELP
jgi:hypothetical protein